MKGLVSGRVWRGEEAVCEVAAINEDLPTGGVKAKFGAFAKGDRRGEDAKRG